MSTEGENDLSGLLPCPFCGSLNETSVSETHLSPTMRGPGALVSVTIRHWCKRKVGVVAFITEVRGRDRESAIQAWNQRA